jgi:hypothetical protein
MWLVRLLSYKIANFLFLGFLYLAWIPSGSSNPTFEPVHVFSDGTKVRFGNKFFVGVKSPNGEKPLPLIETRDILFDSKDRGLRINVFMGEILQWRSLGKDLFVWQAPNGFFAIIEGGSVFKLPVPYIDFVLGSEGSEVDFRILPPRTVEGTSLSHGGILKLNHRQTGQRPGYLLLLGEENKLHAYFSNASPVTINQPMPHVTFHPRSTYALVPGSDRIAVEFHQEKEVRTFLKGYRDGSYSFSTFLGWPELPSWHIQSFGGLPPWGEFFPYTENPQPYSLDAPHVNQFADISFRFPKLPYFIPDELVPFESFSKESNSGRPKIVPVTEEEWIRIFGTTDPTQVRLVFDGTPPDFIAFVRTYPNYFSSNPDELYALQSGQNFVEILKSVLSGADDWDFLKKAFSQFKLMQIQNYKKRDLRQSIEMEQYHLQKEIYKRSLKAVDQRGVKCSEDLYSFLYQSTHPQP